MKRILFVMLCLTFYVARAESNFVADTKAIDFLKYLVRDDYSQYLNGGKSLFSYQSRAPKIKVISPEIVSEYRKNPIAADEKYKGKLVRFVGAVRSIRLDRDGTQYVNFVGGYNDLEDPQGKFDHKILFSIDPTDSYICVIAGKIGPTVYLDKCASYEREIDNNNTYMIPSYLNEQINEWFGHGVLPKSWLFNDEIITMVFAIYWVGTKLEKNSQCNHSGYTNQTCVASIINLLDLAKSGDQNFIDSYKIAQKFLKMSSSPAFMKHAK